MADDLATRLEHHLSRIYPEADRARLVTALLERVAAFAGGEERPRSVGSSDTWSEADVMLITYGDSVRRAGEPSLRTLHDFWRRHLADAAPGLHILPFYPYSSDDGFSVIDYRRVRDDLGSWTDIRALAEDVTLMVDLVVNHVSVESEWFRQFLAGESPGRDYFISLPADTDVSTVVRPRRHRVLVPFETEQGTRHVWATFSHDQVDLDFSNPDVLLEIVDVLFFYLGMGARWIRLDAVGFVWKELGTPCIHRPQTHELVRLVRTLAEAMTPGVVLVSETNVPNVENLSYFGNRNEAHAIYNFSLPPLLIDALIRGRSRYLRAWLMSMPPAPHGCAYFNFTASHDGIGLRPAEGLLGEADVATLVDTLCGFGGRVSQRALADGSLAPYEVNITLYDALKGTVDGEDRHQDARFLCSQAIMLGLEGVPALYIHSLLACGNDLEGVGRTGRARSINRHRWDADRLETLLADPSTPQARILGELLRLVRIRRRQPAFHPNATQYTLQLGERLFGFWRQSPQRDQSIFAVHNLGRRRCRLPLSSLNLVSTDRWQDLIGGGAVDDLHGSIRLEPYQSLWLTNSPR
ncbi:MAG: sugar phosphorylase [Acidobacteriota bacterium]